MVTPIRGIKYSTTAIIIPKYINKLKIENSLIWTHHMHNSGKNRGIQSIEENWYHIVLHKCKMPPTKIRKAYILFN